MSTSDAMRLFLKQVAIRGEFPFEVTIPNQETIEAFEEKKPESVSLQDFSVRDEGNTKIMQI